MKRESELSDDVRSRLSAAYGASSRASSEAHGDWGRASERTFLQRFAVAAKRSVSALMITAGALYVHFEEADGSSTTALEAATAFNLNALDDREAARYLGERHGLIRQLAKDSGVQISVTPLPRLHYETVITGGQTEGLPGWAEDPGLRRSYALSAGSDCVIGIHPSTGLESEIQLGLSVLRESFRNSNEHYVGPLELRPNVRSDEALRAAALCASREFDLRVGPPVAERHLTLSSLEYADLERERLRSTYADIFTVLVSLRDGDDNAAGRLADYRSVELVTKARLDQYSTPGLDNVDRLKRERKLDAHAAKVTGRNLSESDAGDLAALAVDLALQPQSTMREEELMALRAQIENHNRVDAEHDGDGVRRISDTRLRVAVAFYRLTRDIGAEVGPHCKGEGMAPGPDHEGRAGTRYATVEAAFAEAQRKGDFTIPALRDSDMVGLPKPRRLSPG